MFSPCGASYGREPSFYHYNCTKCGQLEYSLSYYDKVRSLCDQCTENLMMSPMEWLLCRVYGIEIYHSFPDRASLLTSDEYKSRYKFVKDALLLQTILVGNYKERI